MADKKGVILSGMRPTGKLHLGHLVGALENWINLQESFDCYFLVADYHVLTTAFDKSAEIPSNTHEMVLDWLAVGLDPERSTFLVQSKVHEHCELNLIFSMITPMPWVERNPTIKEMIADLDLTGKIHYGLMGYPILQAADILLYRADLVPVGEDQVAHVEMTREIARRFNHLYAEVFPEPKSKLTNTPRLPGTDGKKMSKSLGNCIYISDGDEDVKQKVRQMVTDPQKVRRGDPGRPEICSVYSYHELFNKAETDEIAEDCRSGALGCVDCKGKLAGAVGTVLDPIRKRRGKFAGDPDKVRDTLAAGSELAAKRAAETMRMVREAMGMEY
ncbi:MAG: tryptophan--tRNA ligase [Candidatus Glassbacteria bacterium]|nr:tryptophan--tRNA ligase [Candidatus Glassbacteria bacterium]